MKTWGLGYEKAKEKAKQIYNKIGNIPCPIFSNEKVAFTSRGFNHLVRKGRIPRPKNEQKRRFSLLDYVEKIIKNPTQRSNITFEEKEITEKVDRYGSKIIVKKIARFWAITEEIDGCKIKVVIWEVENRQKEFLSIMGDDGIKIDNRKY